MWIKRKKIEKLENELNYQKSLVYELYKNMYVGKKVKTEDCEFVVKTISIKNGEVFLNGGQEITESFHYSIGVLIGNRNITTYSLSINSKYVELCAE